MIRSFLKLAIRNLLKYRAYSVASIINMTVGFCAYILISLYVNYEYSWDKHNVNYSRIYRVQRTFEKAVQSTNGNNISPHTRGVTARLIEGRYPEVEKTLQLRENRGNYLSSDNKNTFWEENGFSSGQNVFDVFSFNFIDGTKENALREPYTVILSKTLADKLFPDGPEAGKTVIFEKKFPLKVTGIYEDFPFNSSFRPNYITSLSSYEKSEDYRNSLRSDYYTYILLKRGQDYQTVNKKITNLYQGFKDYEDEKLSLCPLSMIYLSFNGNRDYLIILFVYKMIGIFILLLSALNYINLTTAHISVRNKEVAVKKIYGSSRKMLIILFQAETIVTTLIGVGLAFVLTRYILPVFNRIIAKDLEFSFVTQWEFMVKMFLIAIFVGFLSGLYPAFFMSGRKALDLFKGNLFRTSNDKSGMRKSLIVIQFSIALLFIILTLDFNRQVRYTFNMDIGFKRENLLYTLISVSRKDASWENLRNKILSHPEITDASMSAHIPMITFGGKLITWEDAPQDELLNARNNMVSYDFIKTMGMHILKGRDFSRDFPSDIGKSCIINESAVEDFGWDDPLGKTVDNKYQVVGVVKDFHNNDVYNIIEPFYMVLRPDSVMSGLVSLAFRVDPRNVKKAKEILASELGTYFSSDPFVIRDYDESFRHQNVLNIYRTIQSLVFFFTCLNILIAVVGLLGLVLFTSQRRVKEIGIRKINGGTSQNIFNMLGREYLSLILIASAIAWPLAFLLFKQLPGTYKCPFEIWPYFLATAVIMIIILVTALYNTFKAAYSNPVDALRYE